MFATPIITHIVAMAATKAQQEHPATENMKDATVQEIMHGTEISV